MQKTRLSCKYQIEKADFFLKKLIQLYIKQKIELLLYFVLLINIFFFN